MNKRTSEDKQRKYEKTSSVIYKKRFIRLAIIALGLIILISYYYLNKNEENTYLLIIKEEETRENYIDMEIAIGDIIEFHWIHSVEHIPWIETFVVDEEGRFILRETKFKGFGAGIPHDKGGETKVEDGYVIMTDLEEVFEEYRWINSHTATRKITLNGINIIEGKDLPHHGFIIMKVQER